MYGKHVFRNWNRTKRIRRELFGGIFTRNCYEDTRYRKRPQFGSRYLRGNNDVFEFNAWDNVEWNEEQENEAKQNVLKNSQIKFTEDQIKRYDDEADEYWNAFYDVHQNRFFKDRHWLFTEFPELSLVSADDKSINDKNSSSSNSTEINETPQRMIFEIGCGVGNTILPILKYNHGIDFKLYGCDFSAKAIEILTEHSEFEPDKCNVFVLDATASHWNVPFNENSLDIIILIFVLSAIHPDKMQHVLNQCFKYLKPNGRILFRDYGQYDMTQLRFKSGKCLQDNFYVRGDGTRVYFFRQDELSKLFETAGFIEEQNLIDRRLQVNRGKMLKMYRIWIQMKYRKP